MRSIPNQIVLLLALVLLSCERERILPYTPVEPLLAMHAVIETGSVLSIQLERTGNLSDPEDIRRFLSTADFEIQWNDQTLVYKAMLSAEDDRFYFKDIIPLPGDFIKITARSEGIREVSGEVMIPGEAFSTLNTITVDETYLNPKVNSTIDLKTGSTGSGYFIVYAEGTIHNSVTGSLENRRFKVSSTDDMIDKRVSAQAEVPGDLIFVHTDGGAAQTLELNISGIPGNFSPKQPKQSLDLVIEQLSPELYEYFLSLYRSSRNGSSVQYVVESNDLYSNIKGGLGIVGSSRKTRLAVYW